MTSINKLLSLLRYDTANLQQHVNAKTTTLLTCQLLSHRSTYNRLYRSIHSNNIQQHIQTLQLIKRYASNTTNNHNDQQQQQQSSNTNTDENNKNKKSQEQQDYTDDQEDVTASARENSDRDETSTLYKWLRRLIIFSIIFGYPYSVIRYSVPLPLENTAINSIAQKGEDSLFWSILHVYMISPSFLYKVLSNNDVMNTIVNVLESNDPASIESKTKVITIISTILLKSGIDELRDRIAAHNGITRALLHVAMSSDIDKETSAYAFGAISRLILNEYSRNEFLANRGIQQISRATRAKAPGTYCIHYYY